MNTVIVSVLAGAALGAAAIQALHAQAKPKVSIDPLIQKSNAVVRARDRRRS